MGNSSTSGSCNYKHKKGIFPETEMFDDCIGEDVQAPRKKSTKISSVYLLKLTFHSSNLPTGWPSTCIVSKEKHNS